MLYKIGVTLIPDIGDISIKKLISYCGSAAEVFRRKRDQLLKIPGLGPHMAKQIMSSSVLHRAEKELKFIQRHNITALFFTDYGYPEKLKHAIDGPALLFYRGTADLNAHRMVSVVGTRKPTQYGLHCCDTLIEQLKDCNVCIISGLAYGIDTRAHQRALELGMPTIGVLAHSLDFIYPYANRHLAKKIYANGGLVTDYISGTPPDRQNFPSRNRIVAGMADAVIVIESGIKGGALITADIANSYNRDVFAFPGKITDAMSLGCNKLINDHKAAIITAPENLVQLMQWDNDKVKKTGYHQQELFVNLSDEEERIVNLLKQMEETGVDKISLQCGIPISRTASVLLELEFKGLIKALPGKQYRLN